MFGSGNGMFFLCLPTPTASPFDPLVKVQSKISSKEWRWSSGHSRRVDSLLLGISLCGMSQISGRREIATWESSVAGLNMVQSLCNA